MPLSGALCGLIMSLSARRAWIEIAIVSIVIFCIMVALRKESVDRNMRFSPILKGFTGSLSARRAWIEIPALLGNPQNDGRRSPQGERG